MEIIEENQEDMRTIDHDLMAVLAENFVDLMSQRVSYPETILMKMLRQSWNAGYDFAMTPHGDN